MPQHFTLDFHARGLDDAVDVEGDDPTLEDTTPLEKLGFAVTTHAADSITQRCLVLGPATK